METKVNARAQVSELLLLTLRAAYHTPTLLLRRGGARSASTPRTGGSAVASGTLVGRHATHNLPGSAAADLSFATLGITIILIGTMTKSAGRFSKSAGPSRSSLWPGRGWMSITCNR